MVKQKNKCNIGIVLAGGVGARMGLGYPKQFAKIAGKTVLEHTLDIFQNHELIDEIIVVAVPFYEEGIRKIVLNGNYAKVSKIINGGKERTDSTKSALATLKGYSNETKLIIHDSVRPLLSAHIINECINKLDEYNAVDVVIPCSDTIVKVNDNKEIIEIPNRNELRQGQTPQCFKLGTLKEAYSIYDKMNLIGTCDCGIVLKALPEEKIAVVAGSETNIKLTQSVDLFLADKLFQSRSNCTLEQMVSADIFTSLKDKVLVVFGGSYGIGAEIIELAKLFGAKTYSFSRSTNVDVQNLETIEQALKTVIKTEKSIDYVVNTAAILANRPLDHMTALEISNMVNINLTGAINVALASKKYLKKSSGSLLNFTSSSYTRGRAFSSVYSSTKAGVVNLTQALAEEWMDEGISINCINPERTKTPMRLNNFGIEADETLLDAQTVAFASLLTLINETTGNVIDVKRKDRQFIGGIIDSIKSEINFAREEDLI